MMLRMKKILWTLVLVLGMVLPGYAGQKEDALIDGLLGFGSRALQSQVEHRQAERAGQAPGETAAPGAADLTKPLTMTLSAELKRALDELLNAYKEQYKAEGRAYAQELGDIVVERVVRDPKIDSTITSLRTLCWFVVGYLTLVTLIMLGCLVYLKKANARLLTEVRRLARGAKD